MDRLVNVNKDDIMEKFNTAYEIREELDRCYREINIINNSIYLIAKYSLNIDDETYKNKIRNLLNEMKSIIPCRISEKNIMEEDIQNYKKQIENYIYLLLEKYKDFSGSIYMDNSADFYIDAFIDLERRESDALPFVKKCESLLITPNDGLVSALEQLLIDLNDL